MTRPPRVRYVVETYVIPLLLALILIVVSNLINVIETRRLTEAIALVALILLGTFLTQYIAFRTLRIQERDALFSVLSEMAFADAHSAFTDRILTEKEVIAIETCAREVWVYAYDLNWETGNSPFKKLVNMNLDQGVLYRYLVPEAAEILLRAEQIYKDLSRIQAARGLVRFRAARREPALMRFSVVIYNPTLLSHSATELSGVQGSETVVVFFPYVEDYPSAAAGAGVPFLAVRGPATARFQEEFVRQWREAHDLDLPSYDL